MCKYVWNVKNVYWVLPNGQMLKIYLSKNNIKLISSKVELIIVSYGVNYFSLSESMIFFYQHTHTYIFLSLLFDFFSFISFSFGCLLKVIITHWTHYDGDILLGLFRIQPASMKPAGTKLIRPLQRPTIGVRRGGQRWSRQTEDCQRMVVSGDLGKLKTADVTSSGYLALRRKITPHCYIYVHTHYNLTYIIYQCI